MYIKLKNQYCLDILTISLFNLLLAKGLMPSANEVTQLVAKGAWAAATTTEAMELCMDGCAQLDEIVREIMRAHVSTDLKR